MAQQITVQQERAQRLASFRDQLEKQTPVIQSMLPAHVPLDRFKRVFMTMMVNNPDMLECTSQSIFTACLRAAADGLMPDGREGAIVKFKDQAQWMPMTAGVLKKLRNSGELQSINAYVVHQRDTFRYRLGDDESIEHLPFLGDDAGPAVAVYAVARTRDGGVYREVMSKAQVEKVRAVSRSGNSGPWVQWWDEMARKTVIRRLAKRLPMSTDREDEIREMLERDDAIDTDASPDVAAIAPPRPTRDQFADTPTAGDGGDQKGGSDVKGNGSGAAKAAESSGQPAEPTEADERAADRMMAAAQAGEDPQHELDSDAVDLTPIAVPMAGGKPDVVAYTTAINRSLAGIGSMVELGEFDLANKPVALAAGGAIVRNYGIAFAQARARLLATVPS